MNQKELLIISITIFVTISVWIIADLFHLSQTRQVKAAYPEFTKPLQLDLDSGVIEKLEEKQ